MCNGGLSYNKKACNYCELSTGVTIQKYTNPTDKQNRQSYVNVFLLL